MVAPVLESAVCYRHSKTGQHENSNPPCTVGHKTKRAKSRRNRSESTPDASDRRADHRDDASEIAARARLLLRIQRRKINGGGRPPPAAPAARDRLQEISSGASAALVRVTHRASRASIITRNLRAERLPTTTLGPSPRVVLERPSFAGVLHEKFEIQDCTERNSSTVETLIHERKSSLHFLSRDASD